MRKRIITITYFLIFLSSSIIASINAKEINSFKDASCNSYLIEDVPYAAQTDFGCFYASLEMLFNYYGKNSTLAKNFFYSGGAYSYCYERKLTSFIKLPIPRPPYFYKLLRSAVAIQGTDDVNFMGSLYGCKFNQTSPDHVVINHKKYWDEWWQNVKYHVNNNDPILTSIDPCAWPIYLEVFNLTEPLKARGGHVIVIVGYNESNSTVCVQDPAAGSEKYYNPKRIGYQWIDISHLELSVKRSFWEMKENGYDVFSIEKLFDTPDQDYAFKEAHDRNIKRLLGDKESYDSDYINPQFNKFGIEAIKALRDDFNSIKFYLLFPAFKIIGLLTGIIYPDNQIPFEYDSEIFVYESKSQKEVCDFLYDIKSNLSDEDLKELCDYDRELLNQNSDNFLELANHTRKLQDAISNIYIIKSVIETKSILNDIVSVLDEIIEIQEAIIAGPND